MSTPRHIGRYELLEEIGRGAMGVVYLAHDPGLARQVAIKTIHMSPSLPATEQAELRERFLREARAAGGLQHPGIVTIHDVGEAEGRFFIAMEYIDGLTLERHTKQDSLLPVDVVVSLIVQACDALDYAHEQRIVHRDIKPANLMLLPSGRLKITDFGLAKNPASQLTQDGVLIGTPNYMSPEQITGRPVDGRSDLFSLAAVMYELLTAQKPFSGDTVTTIMYRILHEVPPMPHMINERIPPAVGRVLVRALEKDPTQRFQSGHEMARALQGRAVAQAVASMSMGAGVAAIPGVPSVFGPATMRPGARPAGQGARSRGAAGENDEYETNKIPAVGRAAASAAALADRHDAEPAARAHAASGARRAARNVAIGIGALALILMLPRAMPLTDRWGSIPSDEQPFWRTAAIVSPAAPAAEGTKTPAPAGPEEPTSAAAPPPAASAGPTQPAPVNPTGAAASSTQAAPPAAAGNASTGAWSPAIPTEGSVAIPITTSPPGGRIYMDDVELPDGVAHLPRGDNEPHTVVAENECFIEQVTWRRSQGPSLNVKLKTPKVEHLPVSSTPSGAAIRLDGKATGLSTPADVPVPVCGEHTVALALDGYKDVQAKVPAELQPMDLSLPRIASGFVTVEAPYALQVLLKGKRIGAAGEKIKLPEGKHTLTLRNEELFVERTLTVSIVSDKTITPAPGLPGVGRVTILASPSNCVISVNGRELGAPPINDHPLAAGTYTVRAVYVPTGESKEASVKVPAGSSARVPFKFTP